MSILPFLRWTGDEKRYIVLYVPAVNPGSELPVVSFLEEFCCRRHITGASGMGTDAIVYAAFILPAILLRHLIDCGINEKTAAQINEKNP